MRSGPDDRCACCGRGSGELLDCAAVSRELGVSRSAAEAFMRELPKIHPPSEKLRKVFVRRSDLERLLDRWTVAA